MDVDVEKIQKEIWSRRHRIAPYEEWFTPAGRPRSAPVYQVQIGNAYLGKERLIKDKDLSSAHRKAVDQLSKWDEQELKARIAEAKRDAKETARADAEAKDEAAKEQIGALLGILAATLDVDDRIDWDELLDKREFPAFSHPTQRPAEPESLPPASLPPKPFWSWLIPALK